MLKYLIIQLDDTSTSFCHYSNSKTQNNLMPLGRLKDAIFWSRKENLTIQFVYPDYIIPQEYKEEIRKTFHTDIVSSKCDDTLLIKNADVVVFNSLDNIKDFEFNDNHAYVLRCTLSEVIDNARHIISILPPINRINIVITDILLLKKDDEQKYEKLLIELSDKIADEYKSGHPLQVNILTDRMLLDKMNNCNAGNETITLCPDGNFYVCPAFYADSEDTFSIGSLGQGLDIKNPQLYKISHAPICRICDAYQCRRCVWLNKKSTFELNIPSREQCVIAHVERNASRKLLADLNHLNLSTSFNDIPLIDYLDPFEKIKK